MFLPSHQKASKKIISPKNLEMSETRLYLRNPFVANPAAGYPKKSSQMTTSVLPEKGVDLSPEEKINKHLERHGTPVSWLARRIPISRPYLQLILRGKDNNKRPLKPEVLKRINEILQTNY
jgi:hypothetical protein